MTLIYWNENYKVISKILGYIGIYEFKRVRPPPRELANADPFDDYKCDDYIDSDYERFLKRNKIFSVKACLKTGWNHRKIYISYTTGTIVTDFLPKIPYFFI